jgi:wyosine [tRNA(Phe)-imidazoG37] synthetase (radical SAM superfamily)
MRLHTRDHDRSNAGLTYVYPVVSRRAGGVSVGLNLNPNKACNWRCVYCQVPGLSYGNAPAIDLDQLERELRGLLEDITSGDFMERLVPEGARRLNDVALSGDGEATSSLQLPEVIARTGRVLTEFDLVETIELVLITNGSMVHRTHVQTALERMAALNGRVWFKLDSATAAGQERLNGNRAGPERTRTNLELAARLCPTWVQTMALDWGGSTLSGVEEEAYLALLADVLQSGAPLAGVLLYGLARESHQPEAPELAALPEEKLRALATRIEALGLEVRVSV